LLVRYRSENIENIDTTSKTIVTGMHDDKQKVVDKFEENAKGKDSDSLLCPGFE